MKNKKIIIGIIGTPTYDDSEYETVAIYEPYRKISIAKDFILFMITPYKNISYLTQKEKVPSLDKEIETYKEMLDLCDGLIILGGHRINNYNEYIINYAIEKNMPILGTCLGMQILSILDNGSKELLADETNLHKQRDVKYVHDVEIIDNTLLSEIVKCKK